MGFLAVSGYEGTERIDLGNGYFVDVKKCLTSSEMRFVQNAMGVTRQQVDMVGGGKRKYSDLNFNASWIELVVHSLVDWNLDDDDKTIWPLDAGLPAGKHLRPGENPYPDGCPRRLSVDRLPDPVFKKIWAECDNLNGPRDPAEAAQFPEPAVGGGEDGDGSPAGADEVPDGTSVLEGAGSPA